MSRWLLVGALLVCCAGAGAEEKTVLAVQAFLEPAQEAALVKVWQEALAMPGVKCALTDNALPHVTFGSWKVTKTELADATAKLQTLDGKLPGAEFAPRPVLHRWGYFLLPAEEPALVQYHAEIHRRLAFPYERFREIDVPGKWWPHLTMFSAQAPAAQEALAQLWARQSWPARLKIAKFGLVTFGPSTVVAEVRCAAGE